MPLGSEPDVASGRAPIVDQLSRDVVVVGGGMAGIFAALGARRCGATTTLVEAGGCVGGQATLGGVHTFCGDTENVNDDWRTLLRLLDRFDGGIAPFVPNDDGRAFSAEHLKYAAQELLQAAGVDVLLHSVVFATQRQGDLITEVLAAGPGGTVRLTARQFVDATGDADLIAAGGWQTVAGGVSLGPDESGRLRRLDRRLRLPMSLYFALVDAGHEVSPTLPDGAPTWQSDEDLPMTSVYEVDGVVLVKMKVIGFSATDTLSLSLAEHAGRRQALALVHHLQTKGYRGVRYPRHRLAWVAPHIGIREGRRIQADKPLAVDELLAGAGFDDAVAVGSYHIDYHWPDDPRRAGTGVTSQVPPYQIPLRAMRPRDTANVLVPGRCMGGEQLAMSSFRVMATCAQTGFAAGVAAGLAVAQDCAVDALDVRVLREQLRANGVRLDRAPYLRYLRSHRGFDGRVGASDPHSVDVAFAPDGSVVLAIAEREQVRLVKCQPGGQTRQMLDLERCVDAVAVRMDETRILPAGSGSVTETDEICAVVTWEAGPAPAAIAVDLLTGDTESVRPGNARTRPRTRLEISADIWSPGNVDEPPLAVEVDAGALVVSGPASHRLQLPDTARMSPAALAPTAGGVIVALGSSDEVWFQHVPYDLLLDGSAVFADRNGPGGLEWLELLRDQETRS